MKIVYTDSGKQALEAFKKRKCESSKNVSSHVSTFLAMKKWRLPQQIFNKLQKSPGILSGPITAAIPTYFYYCRPTLC